MKKIIISLAVVVMSTATFVSVNSNSKLNKQFEANLDALAQSEITNTGRWRTVGCGSYSFYDWKTYCCPNSYYNNCPGHGDCYSTVIFGCDD